MFGELENLTAIGALALEYGACVVQAMGQHVDLGVGPFDELAVHPDEAFQLVEGNGCHGNLPRAAARTSLVLLFVSRQPHRAAGCPEA